MREPFNLPDDVLVDFESGLALNVPVTKQRWPGWWNEDATTYHRILELRKQYGIEIDDFPQGTERLKPATTPRFVPMEEYDA